MLRSSNTKWILLVVCTMYTSLVVLLSQEKSQPEFQATISLSNPLPLIQKEHPKIALCFLTLGPIYNEPVWRSFFEASARLKPRTTSINTVSSTTGVLSTVVSLSIKSSVGGRRLSSLEGQINRTTCQHENEMLASEARRIFTDRSDVISNQSLFSVYVHPVPGYEFEQGSVFFGREVKNRVDTRDSWSTFRIVDAEIALLEEALLNVNNKKFVFLSESCIPLYTPEVIYAQLIFEAKSRVRACTENIDVNIDRYDHRMDGEFMNQSLWRKSSQWVSLRRSHAELLVKETYLKEKFRKYCNGYNDGRFCVSDEHYVPTVLAMNGLESETDCEGQLTFTRFTGGPHPVEFNQIPVSPKIIRSLRHQDGKCNVGSARSTAYYYFENTPPSNRCIIRNASSVDTTINNTGSSSMYTPLGYDCVLFARKFDSSIVEHTVLSSLSCTGGALGYWC